MEIDKMLKEKYRSYKLNHFEKTVYGRNLSKLKNKYSGKRCFIIGNGPSLKAQDLDMLVDEYTFAFNRIYYIFEQTQWRPNFYCTQDDRMLRGSIEDVQKCITTPYIFAPINLYWYYGLKLNTKYYFSQKQEIEGYECPHFSEDIPHQIVIGSTVAYTAIELAAYMGFAKIYLIGIDHNFRTQRDKEGNVVVNSGVKDYFCDNYNCDAEQLLIPKLDVSTKAYLSARHYAETHNIEIYNATRGGMLEVFPRVDFDRLF